MTTAGIRKIGKKKLGSQCISTLFVKARAVTYTTVIMAAANVANEELTADSELARLVSMVSIS
jgi:hypothetical protein